MTKNLENKYIGALIMALFSLAFVLLFSFLDIPLFVSVFALIFFIIIFVKIEWGVYLMAFSLPLINWNFNYSGMEIPFIDLLSILVFFIYFLQRFLARNFDNIKKPHFFSFFAFFLVAILSSLFSQNISTSIWYSIRWILFFYIVYLVLPYNVIKNEKILKNTLVAFSASVLLVSLMGLISILSQDWTSTLARVRPVSIFGIFPIGENQNLIVETLLPGIFILLALKNWYKKDFENKIINILVLFVGAILLLTFSRGAWLSLFFVGFLSAIIYYGKNIFKFLMPLILVFLILLPVIWYMVNLQTTYNVGTTSNKSRLLLTEIAWDGFRDSPIFGKGSGEYINIVAQNIRFRANYGDPVDSHGFLQKILIENGGLGLLAFLIFVMGIFKKYFEVFKSRFAIGLYLPITAAASSIFIFELFNTSYYKGKLWFVVALALVAVNLIEEKKIYEK